MKSAKATWKPTVTFEGPMAEHDMPCAICRENKAVFRCNDGFFEPCWDCQKLGYVTEKLTRVEQWCRRYWK